jgi:hypothetical protein
MCAIPENFIKIVTELDTEKTVTTKNDKVSRDKREGEITHTEVEKLWRMTAWKRALWEGVSYP